MAGALSSGKPRTEFITFIRDMNPELPLHKSAMAIRVQTSLSSQGEQFHLWQY